MAALTGQNEKDLDTQIQEAHDNIIRCKKSRTLVIILGLLVMFGSLRLSDIFNIDDVLAAFLYLTVYIVWIPLFFIFFSVRSSQWKQTYASLVTEKIDFLSVLRKYCTVEEFSLDGKISKSLLESMGWYSMGWLGVITKGRNYLKGTIDGFSIETSYVEVYENRKYRGNIPYFLGQICFLQSHKYINGKILITRAYNKDGFGKLRESEYIDQIDRLLFSRKKDESFLRVSISDNFDKKWWVYSTKPELAGKLLEAGTDMYNLLLDTPRLLFVLYDYNEIVFGGKYGFDLSKGTMEEASKECINAIDLMFSEAIPLITKPF